MKKPIVIGVSLIVLVSVLVQSFLHFKHSSGPDKIRTVRYEPVVEVTTNQDELSHTDLVFTIPASALARTNKFTR
jgi:hypothetical protein